MTDEELAAIRERVCLHYTGCEEHARVDVNALWEEAHRQKKKVERLKVDVKYWQDRSAYWEDRAVEAEKI